MLTVTSEMIITQAQKRPLYFQLIKLLILLIVFFTTQKIPLYSGKMREILLNTAIALPILLFLVRFRVQSGLHGLINFIFKNNIISNCKYVWVKNSFNTTKYSIDNCEIVNNQYYKGVSGAGSVNPGEFDINENSVTKEGEISLRLIDEIDKPIPIDYLHIITGSLGYDMGAGLFKNRKQ